PAAANSAAAMKVAQLPADAAGQRMTMSPGVLCEHNSQAKMAVMSAANSPARPMARKSISHQRVIISMLHVLEHRLVAAAICVLFGAGSTASLIPMLWRCVPSGSVTRRRGTLDVQAP